MGIGAGMTASGGINYSDEKLLKKWFPQYYDLGFRSLMELQGMFWFWNKKEKDMQLYCCLLYTSKYTNVEGSGIK